MSGHSATGFGSLRPTLATAYGHREFVLIPCLEPLFDLLNPQESVVVRNKIEVPLYAWSHRIYLSRCLQAIWKTGDCVVI